MDYRIEHISCERTKTSVCIKMDDEGNLVAIRCPHYTTENISGTYLCNVDRGVGYAPLQCLIIKTKWVDLEAKVEETEKGSRTQIGKKTGKR